MQLGSGVAVVKASGYSSNLTRSLGTSICCGYGCKKTKKKKKEEEEESDCSGWDHFRGAGSIPGSWSWSWIQSLTWELPYAKSAAKKKKKLFVYLKFIFNWAA